MARARRSRSSEPVERPADLDSAIPFPPMEAELVRELPEGDEWQYEPKWDGFRGLLENASGELRLWSRNARPLLRYFPELATLGELLQPRSCLDGEIVIVRDGVLDFDAMQMRLHPAESRVRKLSAEIPATFVAFDVLVWDGVEHWPAALASRRSKLEELARGFVLSPCTADRGEAIEWLDAFEAIGLDGVVAKRRDEPYRAGERTAVVKVKPEKTADCVVAGLRWKGDGERRIATLLLGLWGDDGDLDYVGSAAVAPARHDEVALRVPGVGEEHLVGVRDLDRPAADLELDEGGSHAVSYRSRRRSTDVPGSTGGRSSRHVHCAGSLSGRSRRSLVPWRNRRPCTLS